MMIHSARKVSDRNLECYRSSLKYHAVRVENGFTLVEVLVAMVILLIGMLGVIAMQYHAVSGNAASRDMRVAVNIAKQLSEQMKLTPYADLASSSDTPALDTAVSGGVTFTRAWWVQPDCFALTLGSDNGTCAGLAVTSPCPNDPDTGQVVAASAIRIRTCWQDKDGTDHSITLDTVRWNESVVP